MNDIVFYALLATLGTWLVTALGAATVVLFKSPNPKILNLMLGFAAGVMVAASFWSLLQPAIERAEAAGSMPAFLVATLGFLCGALFMWGSDKCVTYAQRRSALAQGEKNARLNRIILLVLSITLHNHPGRARCGRGVRCAEKRRLYAGSADGCRDGGRGHRLAEFPRRRGGLAAFAP